MPCRTTFKKNVCCAWTAKNVETRPFADAVKRAMSATTAQRAAIISSVERNESRLTAPDVRRICAAKRAAFRAATHTVASVLTHFFRKKKTNLGTATTTETTNLDTETTNQTIQGKRATRAAIRVSVNVRKSEKNDDRPAVPRSEPTFAPHCQVSPADGATQSQMEFLWPFDHGAVRAL